MCDLILPLPKALEYWNVSPLECLIFFASVIVTIFTSIEVGLYVSISASLALLLYRLARPKGEFLGQIQIQSVDGEDSVSVPSYVPISNVGLNPTVIVEQPVPGVLIYRLGESFTYPNASLVNDRIIAFAKEKTCPDPNAPILSLGDRPWNESYAPRIPQPTMSDPRPSLQAMVFDFGGVSSMDLTAAQVLRDTCRQLDNYAGHQVEYHFAQIHSPWILRALVAHGFGVGNPRHPLVELASVQQPQLQNGHADIEMAASNQGTTVGPVVGTNYPFFHLNLENAVKSAESAVPTALGGNNL